MNTALEDTFKEEVRILRKFYLSRLRRVQAPSLLLDTYHRHRHHRTTRQVRWNLQRHQMNRRLGREPV
jgi:hypothetical protein